MGTKDVARPKQILSRAGVWKKARQNSLSQAGIRVARFFFI
jgi:hypothetical protein